MLNRFLNAARGAGLAAMLLTGFGASTPAHAEDIDLSLAKVSPAACPFEVDSRTSCGALTVPENWRMGASSRRITLPFLRVAARRPHAGRAPIVILTGGPGSTIFQALGMLLDAPLADEQDAIFIEPRGYPYADPGLICGSIADLAACHQRWTAKGVDLSRYGVEDAARDFEALRRALKLETWDVYGVSYGGIFALTEARLYPKGIRSLVLDSPAPTQFTYKGNRVSALNALGRMFDSCKANPKCNAAYPDLRRRFIEGFHKLNDKPIIYNGRSINGDLAFAVFYNTLYMTPSLPFAPKLADALARGDIAGLMQTSSDGSAAIAANFRAPKGFDFKRGHALGLNAQVVCSEITPFPAPPEMAEALNSPWPSDLIRRIRPEGWDYDTRCAAWPTTPADPVVQSPVASDIPTLLLSGRFDPIVPLRANEVIALTMSRTTIVQDPGAAHMVLAGHHACVDRAVSQFLHDPTAVIDTSCLAAIAEPAWALPARGKTKH